MDFKKTVLGIEFGSTRIKGVLLDENHTPIAQGGFGWENELVDGVWTYSMEDAIHGLQVCFRELADEVEKKFGEKLTTVGAIGISGMMHGYLPFDGEGKLLTPFRTWRNTMTGKAADELSELFDFNIPQRWSIAHLYQAILNGEEHVASIRHFTTLAGYMHELLTGEKVMGIGEASGMFPIDSVNLCYAQGMLDAFETKIAPLNLPWTLREILPEIRLAGEEAGCLTAEGALVLDPTGTLQPGIPFAAPEGDAGTGMVATNSVRVHTGNVSAGTSDFAMIVTDKKLGRHREIDMVTTPSGATVAMVHCNNCTSDINAWTELFSEFATAIGAPQDKGKLFTMLFEKALEGDADCGGLLSYNYFSGEGVTDFDEGRPVFLRTPDARFTLANFMRMHMLSALATLKVGLDILTKEEKVEIENLYGHGGFFKTPIVGQKLLSAAVDSPVSVMETAGEGGPYGMALLCAFRLWKEEGETLEEYLEKKVFATAKSSTLRAEEADVAGFNRFLANYQKALPVERAAVTYLEV